MADFVVSLTDDEKEQLRVHGVDAQWINQIRELQQTRRSKAAAKASVPMRLTINDLKVELATTGGNVAALAAREEPLAMPGPAAATGRTGSGCAPSCAKRDGWSTTLSSGYTLCFNYELTTTVTDRSLHFRYTVPPLSADPVAQQALQLPASAARAIAEMPRRPFALFLESAEGVRVVERMAAPPFAEQAASLLGSSYQARQNS